MTSRTADVCLDCSSLPWTEDPDAGVRAADRPVLLSGRSAWKDWRVDVIDLLRKCYGHRRIAEFRTVYGSALQIPRQLRARHAQLLDEILGTWTLARYLDAAREEDLPVYLANLALLDLPEVCRYYERCAQMGPNLLRHVERAAAPELFVGAHGTQYGGLHVDAAGGSVWCVCLAGEKEWVVFPPADSEDLKPHRAGDRQLRHSFLNPWDPAACAQYSMERLHPCRVFVRAGEALFLPPNWWHITRNHGLTVTINERWWGWRTLPHLARWFWHMGWGKLLRGTRQPFALY